MSKRTKVGEAEYLDAADYDRLGEFPQQATDAVVGGVIGYPAHWAAFTVSQKSAQEVTVSPGRYFQNDIVYEADEAVSLNLILYMPLAASDEKWVALILRGEENQLHEQRAFETSVNPETSEPVEIPTPTIVARQINVVVQQGLASPAPALKPTIAETDSCIAFVRLTTSGVQEIEPGEGWRAKTLFEVEGRVTSLEIRVRQLFEDTETIRTDLSNVASDVNNLRSNIPDTRLFEQMLRDTSRLSQYANLPEEARNYFFDQGLVKDFWDFTQGGYFRINEGIRFQYVSQKDHILRLLNYDASDISVWDNRLVMPKYTEIVRITSPEGSGRKDIANTVHTVTTATQHTQSHQRIRYGETVNVCENTAGWAAVGSAKAGEIFKSNGQEFVSKGQTSNPWNQTATAQAGHAEYAVQRVIRDTYTTTYTTYNTETFGLSGAMYGQTFLSAQVMVATAIELNLTKVGDTGDIMLCLCEVNIIGAPDYSSVLSKVNVPRSRLKVGWNKFSFEPTLLDQGKRYGWFVVTTGNHQLMSNTGNAFGGGTMFVSSDGIWSQGSTTEDFTFRLSTAKFAASRVVMPFESLGLEGGMTEIEMVFQAWEPAATSIAWELKPQGDTEWTPIDARIDNPLANLPPLVQLRAILIGTEDVAPAINLNVYARAITGRHRTDMRAISKLKTFGFTTNEAQVVVQMDYFDPARHTASPKVILPDNTVVEPSSVTVIPDPIKPTRTKFVANFNLPQTVGSGRVRIDATTDSVIHVPFAQDVQFNAF